MPSETEKPVILLNMAVGIYNGRECEILISQYAQRVCDAGAVPMLMPSIEDESLMNSLLGLADGVLLIGGKDYDPLYYGCEREPETDLSRMRPHFDIAFGRAVLAHEMPVLGICAGCQLLSILYGGKLIQHLPDAELHRGGVTHEARLLKDGCFSRALGLKPGVSFTVNSFHHQAVDPARPGNGLRITAEAFDGSVEAVEADDPARMILGVQFHPERMDDLGPVLFGFLRDEALAFRKRKKGT